MKMPKDQTQENLKAFVNKGKSIARAKGIDWDSDIWTIGRDKTDLLAAGSIHFRGLPSGLKKRDGVAFTEPMNSFAKAYISNLCAVHDYSVGALHNFIKSLRYLYAIESDPTKFNDSTFQAALDLRFSREKIGFSAQDTIASHLDSIAYVLDCHHLSIEPIHWNHSIAYASRYRYPDNPEDQNRRNAKLPSDEVIEAVVDMYHEIPRTEVGDRILICLCILLLITGFRINEALALPWDCVENYMPDRADSKGPLLDEEGMPVIYSRFRQYLPEKSGEKVTARRYLGRIGSQILRAVYEEIQHITKPFHDTAAWMAKHPGRALLPHAPRKTWFTQEEVGRFFAKSTMNQFLRNHSLKSEVREGWSEPKFPRSELERVVLAASKIGIVRSKPWSIRTHEILFMIGDMTFCRASSGPRGNRGIPNAVRPLRASSLTRWLIGSPNLPSVFERYGKKDSQGNPLHITSHQFRHWLNNEMYLGGMSEVQIRYQFGRYNKRSSSDYDHRDPIERAKALRDAARKGEILGGFGSALRQMKVVDREEWIKSAYGNVHWGPLGGCADETIRRADAMPKECASCGGLIVVKGDPEGRAETVRQLEFTEWWLAKAEEDAQDCNLNDDLQVVYYQHKATSLRRIIATHDDPSIRDGTHVLMDFISGSAELLDGACHV